MNIQKLLGDTWPEWELVREIGAGTQGTVYMIRLRESDDRPENYAALKVIGIHEAALKSGQRRGEDLSRLERALEIMTHPGKMYGTIYGHILEAEVMKQMLNHPNIVHLQDWAVVKHSGRMLLLLRMELLLPLDEYRGYHAGKVGTDICSALSALHGNGIYHLDVKPGNIFVGRDGTFKLGDFGSAGSLYSISKGDFPVGTLHYAAPEILSTRSIRSSERDAIHADIYSLGMVLFELLIWEEYGRGCHGPADEPHEREEWFQIQRAYEAGNPECTESFLGRKDAGWNQPSGIRDVVRKALSACPFARYDSADQMREAILAGTGLFTESPHTAADAGIGETFDRFIFGDVRETLILKYPSGAHRRFAEDPYVGELSGLRLTYAGHKPPKEITINGAEIIFQPKNGFVDISLMKVYRDSTWPLYLDLAVRYPHGRKVEWNLIQGYPARQREWFKRPDWT